VEHRAICNTILWRDLELNVHAGDVILNNLQSSFDASLGLIIPALQSGARMVLAEPGEEHDPHRLLERVLMEGVTILELTPVLLRVMLDDPLFSACRTLRWVCCGGEAMTPDLPARLIDLQTDRYLVGPYSGRITLIRPSDAPFPVTTLPDRGWGRLPFDVEVHFVPGQHHSMVKEPHVEELARVLDACLLQGDERVRDRERREDARSKKHGKPKAG
jgi:non-ribosomal peptide synthetase component F